MQQTSNLADLVSRDTLMTGNKLFSKKLMKVGRHFSFFVWARTNVGTYVRYIPRTYDTYPEQLLFNSQQWAVSSNFSICQSTDRSWSWLRERHIRTLMANRKWSNVWCDLPGIIYSTRVQNEQRNRGWNVHKKTIQRVLVFFAAFMIDFSRF